MLRGGPDFARRKQMAETDDEIDGMKRDFSDVTHTSGNSTSTFDPPQRSTKSIIHFISIPSPASNDTTDVCFIRSVEIALSAPLGG
jgi:hypothetical protein